MRLLGPSSACFWSMDSFFTSIFHPVSRTARRTFWPLLPMASESWSSGTMTSMDRSSSYMKTLLTLAGERAEQMYFTASSE